MRKPAGTERVLKALLDVVLSEVRTNLQFAERITDVLNPESTDRHTAHGRPEPRQPQAPEPTVKRGNRRTASVVDPIAAVQLGEMHLRSQLAPLDLEQLRDVMADYRMDPSKLAMKWKDRERVINHIVTTSIERGQKGDAFRA